MRADVVQLRQGSDMLNRFELGDNRGIGGFEGQGG